MAFSPDVLIVGAGLAGLCCARRLHQANVSFQILEADTAVGGRIRTDTVDGFLLDRGFQVFLPSYPEAQQLLDYPSLKLHAFYPGSLIRYQGNFHRLADLWRRPQALFATLFNPAATLGDKLRIARLRADVLRSSLDELYQRPESSTLQNLQRRSFSPAIIDRFFRPFFGGIFLERDLSTSSRHFEFLFRMFSLAQASLPAQGMEAIPRQLASHLPADSIRTGMRATEIAPGTVVLANGERLQARAVVVAVEGSAAAQLVPDLPPRATHSVWCLYYAADKAPVTEPILVLNGDGIGPINNLCVPNTAAATYAPSGAALVSVTVLDPTSYTSDTLEPAVRQQLLDWYGTAVQGWRHLSTYHIKHALPEQTHLNAEDPGYAPRRAAGLYVCGDYCQSASINGAMASGRHTAEAVLGELQ
jgi:phytoene dehydrogenase-like protein